MNTETLYRLLDKLKALRHLPENYVSFLLLCILLFALLNCFFGYSLRKLWSVLIGLVIGAGSGFLIAKLAAQSETTCTGMALGCGLIFGLLSFLLYRIASFFLVTGFLFVSFFQLFQPSFEEILLLSAISVVIALVGVPFEKISLPLVTSCCGALLAVTSGFRLLHKPYSAVTWIMAVLLACLGLVFQFKPWKHHTDDEKTDASPATHRSGSSRSSSGSGQTRRPANKAADRHSADGRPSAKNGASTHGARSEAGKKETGRKVSQNTVYDFHFVPEEEEEPEKTRRKQPSSQAEMQRRQPSSQTEMQRRQPSSQAEPQRRPQTSFPLEDPDLSEIRQQLSAEVQEIYESNQHTAEE